MTARNAGKDERALKHGHERTQMLITYRQPNVDKEQMTGKVCSPREAAQVLRKQELRNRDAEDFQKAEHALISTNLKPCRLFID